MNFTFALDVLIKFRGQGYVPVSYTKRRSGVFKKASELCTLCGAQLAVINLRDANIKELNTQLTKMDSEVESAKKTNEELQKKRMASQEQNWWDRPVDNIGYADLAQLKMALLQLGEAAEKHIE
ncbi:agamous-like MADS-box protein AGL61 [Bidens hawaiensis]|uniref:agamous-like MADS-box protein AGL61 n=1 Tax=Bidens hawaiensis TaxID=980011 RepID=UPI00404998BA